MDADLIPDFRRAVRGHLADRPSVSQPATTVNRHLTREFGSTVEDTAAALLFLASLGQLTESTDSMGGRIRYYQINAAGIIAHEAEG